MGPPLPHPGWLSTLCHRFVHERAILWDRPYGYLSTLCHRFAELSIVIAAEFIVAFNSLSQILREAANGNLNALWDMETFNSLSQIPLSTPSQPSHGSTFQLFVIDSTITGSVQLAHTSFQLFVIDSQTSSRAGPQRISYFQLFVIDSLPWGAGGHCSPQLSTLCHRFKYLTRLLLTWALSTLCHRFLSPSLQSPSFIIMSILSTLCHRFPTYPVGSCSQRGSFNSLSQIRRAFVSRSRACVLLSTLCHRFH